jgi:hypothetical protein
MRNTLLQAWAKQSKKAWQQVQRLLAGGFSDQMDYDDLARILRELQLHLSDDFVVMIREPVETLLGKAYVKAKKGVIAAHDVGFLLEAFDEQAIGWLQEHHLYWIRGYYTKHMSGKIAGIVADGLQQGFGRAAVGDLLRDAITGRYKGITVKPDHYWRLLAANAMNRGRMFGKVAGYQNAYVQMLRVVNPLDERTSAVCIEMEGTIIPVRSAARQRDEMMEARKPEDVKQVAPWLKAEDIAGTSLQGKISKGAILPPYHANCRSDVVEA